MVLTLGKYKIKVVTPKMTIDSQKQASGKKKYVSIRIYKPIHYTLELLKWHNLTGSLACCARVQHW